MLLGTTIGAAHALTSPAESCFKPFLFVDVFRVTTISSSFSDNCPTPLGCATLLFGTMTAYYGPNNPNNYQLPLVGSQASDFNQYGTLYFGLHAVNGTGFPGNTSLFGGHSDCTVTFHFGTGGAKVLTISCNGGERGIWTKSGVPAHEIVCATPIPLPAPSAKALGRCSSDPEPC